MKRVTIVGLGIVLALTLFAMGSVEGKKPPQPVPEARCLCPLIWAPVICDNGRTYPNACEARCAHAKNCVPTGDI